MSKPQVIGLISEDPYDSTALRNLLERYYNIQLKAVLKNVKGSQLDSPKAKKLLGIELKSKKYKHIIYSRDLDGPRSDSKKLAERNQWFKNLDALNKNTGIFLLHIYELESLIFADIDKFNKPFKTKIKFKQNPESIPDPKERLMRETRKSKRKFRESENPEVFKGLDLQVLKKNCRYFREFIHVLEEKTGLEVT